MAIQYEAVIGLEVHAQLLTRTKMFCSCPIAYGADPNTQICPVCLGLPGALPVPNRHAIELAMRAALALGCEVRGLSRFARKNYFYPDLSKGYQISQFELPMNEHGVVNFNTEKGVRSGRIIRIHVEEDAAKNLHGVGAGTDTLVDYNRGGTALIEIVGAPDLRSAEEAEAYLRVLRDVLMFVGANDGNLDEGSFRCDANVSIRPVGEEKLGTRTEIKNINSFRFVRKAIEYEIARQEALVSQGGKVTQETRTWSDNQGKTISLRSKEDAHDYRYFADPDLPTLIIDDAWLERVRASQPEHVNDKRARFVKAGLTDYDAQVLTGHPRFADYFDETCAALTASGASASPKKVSNFITSEVLRYAKTDGLRAEFPVSAAATAELLQLVEVGTINGKIAKDVFVDMVATGKSAKAIVHEKNLVQVTDVGAIEKAVADVVAANPKEVEKYRAGKINVLGFFQGQVLRAHKTANPAVLKELLEKALAG